MWQGVLKKVFSVREKVAASFGKVEDEEKPFLDHMEDLRKMLTNMILSVIVALVFTLCFIKPLMVAIRYPLKLANLPDELSVISVAGSFMMSMNVSLISAIILSFPALLYFLMQFILPGLKENERKLIAPILLVGGGLFFTGCLFSYWLVLPKALEFFNAWAQDLGGTKNMWSLEEYVTFSTRFVLIFGISFEFPVLVLALVKLEIINYKLMSSTRSYAIIAVAVFSAFITPTSDIMTMGMMAGPLYIMYEICIWIAYSMHKKMLAENPEHYAEQERIEAEMKKEEESTDWENNTNPWFGGDTANQEDEDDIRPTIKRPTISAAPFSSEDNSTNQTNNTPNQPSN
jgi:Tat protein translocase TatC